MSQPLRLAALLALLAFPILEIGLLIRAGQEIGFWRLALIVVLTAILGSVVIRRIGFSVLTKARAQMDSGRGMFEPLFDGLLQFTAGMLLIFPGLISDLLGLVLLIPVVRQTLIKSGLPKIFGTNPFETRSPHDPFQRPRDPNVSSGDDEDFEISRKKGVTIEGEYERVKEEPVPPERALRTRSGPK